MCPGLVYFLFVFFFKKKKGYKTLFLVSLHVQRVNLFF